MANSHPDRVFSGARPKHAGACFKRRRRPPPGAPSGISPATLPLSFVSTFQGPLWALCHPIWVHVWDAGNSCIGMRRGLISLENAAGEASGCSWDGETHCDKKGEAELLPIACHATEQLPCCLIRTALLERCLRRLEYEKAKDADARAQADQLEAERAAMQAIDWCGAAAYSGAYV